MQAVPESYYATSESYVVTEFKCAMMPSVKIIEGVIYI